jgi:hypothetical protein
MRFEVRYPTGAVHEVELQGTLAVLGRDPSCDLVLNDTKCSRRHAVIEAGPDGLVVRDSGSANGVFLNGKRIERAGLATGDEVRLGEVMIKVLPEEVSGTLVMGPDEVPVVTPANVPPPRPFVPSAVPVPAAPAPPALPRPTAPPAAPRPAAPARAATGTADPLPHPLTAMTLAALWLLSAVGYLAMAGAVIGLGQRRFAVDVRFVIAAAVALAFVSVVVGVGLWLRAPWARTLQLIAGAIGLLTCVYAPVSAVALAYMLRTDAQIHFSGRRSFRDLTDDEARAVRAASGEPLFTGAAVVGLMLSVALAAAALVLLMRYA